METFHTGMNMTTTLSLIEFNYSDIVLPSSLNGCIALNFTTDFLSRGTVDNLISADVLYTWERIAYGIILPILFLISLPCNTLNIVIFFKHGIKERINLCLFLLSLVDWIFIVQAFCHFADRIYNELTHQPIRGPLTMFMVNNYLYGLFGFSWASSWISTVIICERCFCVISPLRSQTVLKTRTMWFLLLLPSAISLGGYFVVHAKWQFVCVFHPADRVARVAFYLSEFYIHNKEWIEVINSVVYGLIIPYFCIITVIVATIITVVKLRSITEWRQKSSLDAGSLSSRDLSVTRMLVGTSVLYIVCFSPRSLLRIAMIFVTDLNLEGRYFSTYGFLTITATVFEFINSSFNFFVYYYFGSKFRATLKTLFHRKAVQVT